MSDPHEQIFLDYDKRRHRTKPRSTAGNQYATKGAIHNADGDSQSRYGAVVVHDRQTCGRVRTDRDDDVRPGVPADLRPFVLADAGTHAKGQQGGSAAIRCPGDRCGILSGAVVEFDASAEPSWQGMVGLPVREYNLLLRARFRAFGEA